MADTGSPTVDKCKTCNKPAAEGQTLKRCGHCKGILYCSRDCQKADWKPHKAICASKSQPGAESNTGSAPGTKRDVPRVTNTSRVSRALEADVEKPFHKLYAKQWLHGRPEKDVYKLLIDTHRMRVEDHRVFGGQFDMGSNYGGAINGGESGFRRFLGLVECQRGLLPSWWSPTKANECIALGLSRPGWSSLACTVEKSSIVDHYGDRLMPRQLRMFSEQIYGTTPNGQSGARMLQSQMSLERDGGYRCWFHVDWSHLCRSPSEAAAFQAARARAFGSGNWF